MKIIRTLISVIRIIGLMVAAFGLLACALAQKEGSFWNLNYELAFSLTEYASYVVWFTSIPEFVFRLSKVTENTIFIDENLYIGFLLLVGPIAFVGFFIPDIRALQIAIFMAAIGSGFFIRSLPKDSIVEVPTFFN